MGAGQGSTIRKDNMHNNPLLFQDVVWYADPLFWMVFLLIVSMILTIVKAWKIEHARRHPKPKVIIPVANQEAKWAAVYERRKFGRDVDWGGNPAHPLDGSGYRGE